MRLENIEIKYDTVILKKTDIEIPAGRITLIRGASGSGKSSLLYRIGLISEDHHFQYLIDGNDINQEDDISKSNLRKEKMSFVLQDNSLFDQYDVLGNMELYASFNGRHYTERQLREILQMVNLNVPFHQSIQTLSGGEKQRVAIACALCKDTDIIILDEPTSFLDHENTVMVFEVLRRICDTLHKTIILSSHHTDAVNYADEVYEIYDQEIHEIKHSENDTNVSETRDDEPFRLSFYRNYMKYFLKKYRKFEYGMILLITVAMLLMNGLIIYTDHSVNASMSAFEQMSDNQIFVTKDADNVTVDSNLQPFHLDWRNHDADIYPYIDTFAEINGNIFPVVPLFNDNDISLLQNYRKDSIYCSYSVYQQLNAMKINVDSIPVTFTMRLADNTVIKDTVAYHNGGILESNVNCPYFSKQNLYIYCDGTLLNEVYQRHALNNLESYKGYTVVAKDYDSYKKCSEELGSLNVGINRFFVQLDAMDQLIKIGNLVKTIGILSSFLLTTILFIMIEIQYYRRRQNELVMLKMNGMNQKQMLKMMSGQTVMKCMMAFLVNMITLSVILQCIEVEVFFVIGISLLMCVCVSITCSFIDIRLIRHISAEEVLREQS